jgi:hypothetical protein
MDVFRRDCTSVQEEYLLRKEGSRHRIDFIITELQVVDDVAKRL